MTPATLIQHYEVLEVLTQGRTETVYLVRDRQAVHQPHCLLQVVSCAAALRSHAEVAARRRRQVGEHPRIPQLLAFWYEAGQFYQVFERVDGHPLAREILSGKRLSESYVLKLLQDTLEALAHVHQQQQIHQNVQPSSLIRQTSTGTLFLSHFGEMPRLVASQLSADGEIISPIVAGNPDYIAPEQQYGEPEFASDLYSLGLVAVAALSGESPSYLPRDPVTAQVDWRDRISASPFLTDFLDRLLQAEPGDRFDTAQTALAALETAQTKVRIANDSKVATLVASPGLRQLAANQLETTAAPAAIPSRYLWRILAGTLVGLLLFGIGVKAFQWSSYRLTLLRQTFSQDWRVWPRLSYPEATAQELTNLLADGSIQLRPAAATAFWQMTSAAQAEGIRLYPLTGHLTRAEQRQRATQEKDYVTGYAIDIADLDAAESSDRALSFAQTRAFRWLQSNATDYSFEPSVSDGSREPWHWRYVGDTKSQQMFEE
ncbi:MAG: hypothetical protein F6J97_08005 [Leptolyngbya sp. SIO4C1]|nr:hypothetical protein [Leptolyngbya sp. SIO4C1]